MIRAFFATFVPFRGHTPPAPIRVHPRLSAAVALLLLAGCGGGGDFLNENDRLRAVNLKLERQVETLQKQLALRLDEIDAARQALGGAPAVEGARPPRLARIVFDRYTSAVDTDADGVDDTVRIYIRTLDGQGRFMPVSGEVTARLVAIASKDAPDVVADRTWSPSQWDEAYRAGFLTAHYTIELELPQPLPPGVQKPTLHVTLTQGATGAEFTHQQVIPLDR